MLSRDLQSIAWIGVIFLVGAALAWAGSQGSVEVFEFPLFALCGLIALLLNWVIFIPSFVYQTEHYFDLSGSLTYLVLVSGGLLLNSDSDPRAWLLGTMVVIWAVRLGTFLFRRVEKSGGDGRFDNLKPHFPRFLMTWTLQALWVFMTAACALAAMVSVNEVPLGGWALLGGMLWVAGFVLEVAADAQKSAFRADPANRDRFIDTGLWAWSRHPNYCGEICLWLGVTLVGLPALSGWQYATLVSPVFVFILLTRISGVPLLEARGRKKWGDDEAYRDYLERTPRLIPRPPRASP